MFSDMMHKYDNWKINTTFYIKMIKNFFKQICEILILKTTNFDDWIIVRS